MNLATSPNSPFRESQKTAGTALMRFAGYTLLVFGLAVLLYNLPLNKMWLVPVLAEMVLIKSTWSTGSFWKGLLARSVGLTIGNALAYFHYVKHVIYEGKKPWSEEALWFYIIVAVQTIVSAVALVAIRRLRKAKPITA